VRVAGRAALHSSDSSVRAGSASGDSLSNSASIVADTELSAADTNETAVVGARSATGSRSRSNGNWVDWGRGDWDRGNDGS
jgi:hypothetical protein